MEETLSHADLNEMLGIAYLSQDSGFPVVQICTEHIIEIIQRLLEWENPQ